MKPTLLRFFGALVLSLTVGCASKGVVSSHAYAMWALEATPLDRTAAELDNDTHEHLAWARSYRARLLEVEGRRTIENTLVPYNEMMMHLDAAANDCALFAYVHPDPRVRAVAEEGKHAVAKYLTELKLDRGLYDAFRTLDVSRSDAEARSFVASVLHNDPAYKSAEHPLSEAVQSRMDAFHRELAHVLLSPEENQPPSEVAGERGVGQSGLRVGDVLRGTFDVTSRLWGIRYERVHGLNLWHQAVTAWDVYDGDIRLGRIYVHLDSHVSETGPVRHFVYRRGVGGVRLPQSALVGTLTHRSATSGRIDVVDSSQIDNLARQYALLVDNILSGDRRWIRLDGFELPAMVPNNHH